VEDLLEWYDQSLNWDYPPNPRPWRQEECDRFNDAVKPPELMEDPDLDEYLKDPKGFMRK